MTELQKLIDIVKTLRAPNGCPWDKEQTLNSLTPYIIEEAYELTEAMSEENFDNLKEELGDVLLHVIMISNIAEEKGQFTFSDVAHQESNKMIYRHPHVFGDKKVNSVDDVWKNWEALKKKEKKSTTTMASIPKDLPALMQAEKIQKRAAREGFDWKSIDGPMQKIEEEIDEMKEVITHYKSNPEKLTEEAGDLLFSITNLLRKLKVNPEEALRKCNHKFMDRFTQMEVLAKKENKIFSNLSLKDQESYWHKIKKANQK